MSSTQRIIVLVFCLNLLIFKANGFGAFHRLENCATSNVTMTFEECKLDEHRFSIHVIFLRPIEKFFVHANLYLIEGSNSKQLFKVPEIEWCSIVNNKKTRSSPIFRIFVQPIMKQYPNLFKCPLVGELTIRNLTLDTKITAMLPNGIFRIKIHAFNDEDKQAAHVTMVIKMEN